MICFNGSDLISLKANNGLLQPRLKDDDDDDTEVSLRDRQTHERNNCQYPSLR